MLTALRCLNKWRASRRKSFKISSSRDRLASRCFKWNSQKTWCNKNHKPLLKTTSWMSILTFQRKSSPKRALFSIQIKYKTWTTRASKTKQFRWRKINNKKAQGMHSMDIRPNKCSTSKIQVMHIKLSERMTYWKPPIFILSLTKRAIYLKIDFMPRPALTKQSSKKIKLITITAWREAPTNKQESTTGQSVTILPRMNTQISCSKNHRSLSRILLKEAIFHIAPFSTKTAYLQASQELHLTKTPEERGLP